MKTVKLFLTMALALSTTAFLLNSCDKEQSGIAPGAGEDEMVNELKAGGNGASSYIVILNEDLKPPVN
jgi:hypothetical protein